jgi:MFS transporter, PAT family, beta-lactamase induction signal transducer AmpG
MRYGEGWRRFAMRRQLPPWAMGLAIAPLGFYYGFISTAMPILLAAHHVSVGKISEVSAVGFSPTFWAFLLCPVLDVRFTRRTYALFFAGVAGVCLGLSTLLTANLVAFTTVLTAGCAAAVMFGNTHQGWMPDVIEDKHYSHVGATTNIANLGAAGLFATLTVVLVRTLPALPAAGLLGLTVMAPTVMLFFIPLPATPTRGVAETFGTFFHDLYSVCKRPGCILGLICFVSPTACFALTNLFSGVGADFHTPERWVTVLNGPGVATFCSLGCLAGIAVCSKFPRRLVYILTGFGGATAALGLIRTPHTLAWFAAGVLAYNFFQGINYTAFSSLCYEIVGPRNPLAATQMALLAAATNFPISYMTAVDGHFHTTHGLAGMLAVDGLSSITVGTILLMVMRRFGVGRTDGRTEPAPAYSGGG